MAATTLYSNLTTAPAQTYTTPDAVTFTSGRVVLAMYASAAASGTVGAQSLDAVAGLTIETFDWWGLAGEHPTAREIIVFKITPTQNVSSALTFRVAGGVDQTEQHVQMVELGAGEDIVQYTGSTQNGFQTGMDSITLESFNPDNGTLLFLFKGSPDTVTAGDLGGFSVLNDEGVGSVYGSHALWKASEDLDPDVDWGDSVHSICLAFEIGVREDERTDVYTVPYRNVTSRAAGITALTHSFIRLRANKKYVVTCVNRDADAAETVTPTGTGITFTEIETINNPSVLRTTSWLTEIGASDFVGAITFTAASADSQSAWGFFIHEIAGTEEIVQSATGQTAGASASLGVTLDPFADAAHRTFFIAAIISSAVAMTVDTNYALLTNLHFGSGLTHQEFAQTINSSDTTPAVAIGGAGSQGGAIAMELQPTAAEEEEPEATPTHTFGFGKRGSVFKMGR